LNKKQHVNNQTKIGEIPKNRIDEIKKQSVQSQKTKIGVIPKNKKSNRQPLISNHYYLPLRLKNLL